MQELNIQLRFSANHFREIYYRNGQGSIFTNKPFRNVIIIPIALIIFTGIIYLLSIKFQGISWLIGVGSILIVGTGIYAAMAIAKYSKWKIGIEKYLKNLNKYKSYKLSVTDGAIEVSLDSETIINKWENITSAFVGDECVLYIHQKPFYIFPAKSMESFEFQKLKEAIREKIKT